MADAAKKDMLGTALLDELDQCICIADVENYDMLFANKVALSELRIGDYRGRKCYEAMQGLSEPCPFCNNDQLVAGKTVTWEHANKLLGKTYALQDRLISFDGRRARMETAVDISEYVEREEKFKRMTSNIPAAIIVYRMRDGIITVEQANEAIEAITRNSPDALLSGDFMKLLAVRVHPDDLEAARQGYLDMFSDAHEADFSYRNWIEPERTRYRWLRCRGKSFPQPDSSQLAYAVYTDITDDREAELARERRFETELSFLESVSDSYLSAVRCNISQDSLESVAGTGAIVSTGSYTKAMARVRESMLRESDRKNFERKFSRESLLAASAAGIEDVECEYYSSRPNMPHPIWVKATIKLFLHPESGDVVGFAYEKDINRRKITEIVLDRAINRQYDFIVYVRGKLNTTTLLSVTGSFGLKPESDDYEADMHAYVEEHVVADDRSRAVDFLSIRNVLDALRVEDSCSMTLQMLQADRVHFKKLEFCMLDRENSLLALICTDLTDLHDSEALQSRRLQEALDKANQASRAKSEFLSRMSHDIRTPMNGIIGMTRIARAEDNPAATEECLAKIDMSSRFLLGLVNDVLDMSKAESGKIELHLEPYPVADFLEYVDAVIVPLVEEKRQRLVIDAKPIEEAVPLMDILRVNQIYFNLFSNAVKYTPEAGTIAFKLRESQPASGRLAMIIQISDSGIGMSEDFQKRIFEPFSQENRNDVSEIRGSGLGLAIVKKLVDLMGGSIEVKSALGQGTTFTVCTEFDSISADEARLHVKADAPHVADVDLAGKHILLCEDHPLNQEIALAILKAKGMHVEVAENGQVSVEMFAESPVGYYDAVLMDIRMPILDGYEATRALRALGRPDAKTVPIIAMTADAFADDVEKCLEAGMNAHVAKPIEPDKLYASIARFCG